MCPYIVKSVLRSVRECKRQQNLYPHKSRNTPLCLRMPSSDPRNAPPERFLLNSGFFASSLRTAYCSRRRFLFNVISRSFRHFSKLQPFFRGLLCFYADRKAAAFKAIRCCRKMYSPLCGEASLPVGLVFRSQTTPTALGCGLVLVGCIFSVKHRHVRTNSKRTGFEFVLYRCIFYIHKQNALLLQGVLLIIFLTAPRLPRTQGERPWEVLRPRRRNARGKAR